MKAMIFIALGGALGSILRYGLILLFQKSGWTISTTPTFLANIIGCFLLGTLLSLALKEGRISEEYKLFLSTGFCGGLTTFSTFTGENYYFLSQKNFPAFILYASATFIFGLLFFWLGTISVKN
ncbi:MAG: CrcB family protein [Saprospiraceae bacterium]|nr:CrcB family protein [Saprospiraceae bacterium]